jgi:hypothetical protein
MLGQTMQWSCAVPFNFTWNELSCIESWNFFIFHPHACKYIIVLIVAV